LEEPIVRESVYEIVKDGIFGGKADSGSFDQINPLESLNPNQDEFSKVMLDKDEYPLRFVRMGAKQDIITKCLKNSHH
jgi:hypothetical protein